MRQGVKRVKRKTIFRSCKKCKSYYEISWLGIKIKVRAVALGAPGRRLESCCPDSIKSNSYERVS